MYIHVHKQQLTKTKNKLERLNHCHAAIDMDRRTRNISRFG